MCFFPQLIPRKGSWYSNERTRLEKETTAQFFVDNFLFIVDKFSTIIFKVIFKVILALDNYTRK